MEITDYPPFKDQIKSFDPRSPSWQIWFRQNSWPLLMHSIFPDYLTTSDVNILEKVEYNIINLKHLK